MKASTGRLPRPTSDPEHYASLAAVKQTAFDLMRRGALDRRAAFHTPVFVTNGIDGFPAARTVVLRGLSEETRTIVIHSDRRSRKVAEIMSSDRGAIVFYGDQEKIQVRLIGYCTLHHEDDLARGAWQRLPSFSRHCYLGDAPGTVSRSTTSGLSPEHQALQLGVAQTEAGFENFVVIQMHFNTLEWLYLNAHGHRRARLVWSDDNDEQGFWLTP